MQMWMKEKLLGLYYEQIRCVSNLKIITKEDTSSFQFPGEKTSNSKTMCTWPQQLAQQGKIDKPQLQ